MYIRRLQIDDYGPIEQLDIDFPFIDATPMPVVLVGANGSGKTIVLSHIVNSLLQAQSIAYPASRELPENKVYKVRSSRYIRIGRGFSYSQLEFDGGYEATELCYRSVKQEGDQLPTELDDIISEQFWNQIPIGSANAYSSNARSESQLQSVGRSYRAGCALYFPSDRAESPAWLNPVVLEEGASEPDLSQFAGSTDRILVNERSMRTNRDWLIGILFDKHALDIQFQPWRPNEELPGLVLNLVTGYTGDANALYDAVIEILKKITGRAGTRFGIGRRNDRIVSLMDGETQVVPNIFQLSSGELMLLDMCLSILRDFDWSEGRFQNLSNVTGVVIVDEIDLHLHMRLQRTVLPDLLKMFPNVQFVVTTHSPFFVLGMQEAYGDNGLEIRRMPEGDLISPEDFSEFDSAYAVIAESDRFARNLHAVVASSTMPILVVEGISDIEYLRKAAELLGRTDTLDRVHLHDGNGEGSMKNYWKSCTESMSQTLGRQVLFLFDCDVKIDTDTLEKGNLVRRVIPQCSEHPVLRGIENRFARDTLEGARTSNGAWFDVIGEHSVTSDGVEQLVPESWTVPNRHKMALCGWLCENGLAEDFAHFGDIFDLIDESLSDTVSATE